LKRSAAWLSGHRSYERTLSAASGGCGRQ